MKTCSMIYFIACVYKLWIIKFFVFRVVLKACFIIIIYTVYLRPPTVVLFFVSHLSPFCLLKTLMLHYFRWSLEICFYATVNSATVAVGNQGFLTKEITFLKEKGKKQIIKNYNYIKRWDYFVYLICLCLSKK